MPGLTIVTPPSLEPVTLAEAKLFARIDVTDDDALVTDLIVAARRRCEDWLGWALVTQTWDLFLDEFPDPVVSTAPRDGFTPLSGTWAGQNYLLSAPIVVPLPPLASVTFVKYTDYTGAIVTVSSSDYVVDTTSALNGIPRRGRLAPAVGKTWPIVLLQALNGVNVRFVAGFGAAASNVPEHARLAIKELVAFWYQHRDAVDVVPDAVAQVLSGAVGGFAYA